MKGSRAEQNDCHIGAQHRGVAHPQSRGRRHRVAEHILHHTSGKCQSASGTQRRKHPRHPDPPHDHALLRRSAAEQRPHQFYRCHARRARAEVRHRQNNGNQQKNQQQSPFFHPHGSILPQIVPKVCFFVHEAAPCQKGRQVPSQKRLSSRIYIVILIHLSGSASACLRTSVRPAYLTTFFRFCQAVCVIFAKFSPERGKNSKNPSCSGKRIVVE